MKKRKYIFAVAALIFTLAGCCSRDAGNGGDQAVKDSWIFRSTEFVVSRQDHWEDCEKLQKELSAQGIRIKPETVMLGCEDWGVDSRQFARAKKAAIAIIARDRLTLAIEKDNRHKQILEEYEQGRKVGETSYASKDEK